MTVLVWILLGLVAGAIAKMLMPGNDPGGIIITILLGIVGAFIGGWVWTAIAGGPGVTGFNLPSVLIAILGAIIVLAIYRLLVGGRTRAL
ncbi:MAG: GlsB/YeaQ/YmgE family stress response membrane protein [Dehalococcoidia bacterium]